MQRAWARESVSGRGRARGAAAAVATQWCREKGKVPWPREGRTGMPLSTGGWWAQVSGRLARARVAQAPAGAEGQGAGACRACPLLASMLAQVSAVIMGNPFAEGFSSITDRFAARGRVLDELIEQLYLLRVAPLSTAWRVRVATSQRTLPARSLGRMRSRSSIRRAVDAAAPKPSRW